MRHHLHLIREIREQNCEINIPIWYLYHINKTKVQNSGRNILTMLSIPATGNWKNVFGQTVSSEKKKQE